MTWNLQSSSIRNASHTYNKLSSPVFYDYNEISPFQFLLLTTLSVQHKSENNFFLQHVDYSRDH